MARKVSTLGDILHAFLREEGLETPLNEHRIIQAWPEVMGQAITRYTGQIDVRGGVMYIQIKSPALKNDLMMGRTQLVQRLNQHIGAQVITGITFY